MAQSVKFTDDAFVDEARMMSELQGRSLSGQITHWAQIGRAVERSGDFDHMKISRVLAGQAETTTLSAMEKAVWAEQFFSLMEEPGREEEALYVAIERSGKAVGLALEGQTARVEDTPDG